MAPVALVGPSANDVTAFYALLQASFTDASLLGDATSYQSMAYTRMVNGVNDVYFYTVPLSETKQLQRYVLTLLDLKLNAFAANGTTDDCGWSGVTCDDEEANNATYSGTAGSAAAGGTTGVVTELNWARRGLTGTLPNELAKLSQLQVLDLGENGAALTGPIPEALYTMSASLRDLYLHGNALTGPLSDAGLASLTSLSRLFLGDNRLTGTLPQGLGSPGTGSGTVRPLST